MLESFDIPILFEDHHLIAVIKPARLPVASDASGDVTLLTKIRDRHYAKQLEGKKGYCVPIHFLDRPVSGTIVFALSSKSAARLNEQFRNRTLSKRYFALVEGRPTQEDGTLIHYLAKEKQDNRVRIVHSKHPEGKLCKLSYRVIATQGHLTWVEVHPETGRSHQIRVQLASLGTPIYGDVKYGASEVWDGRIALHAATLTIKHPTSKEPMALRAPVDEAWLKVWGAPAPMDS
ncbi:MAG: RluA family pseudouridine synthase [Proteobacteria bacterium]|nr:MAG: RluA family pseudouridine synthase [Pseudomonadota bacterium]